MYKIVNAECLADKIYLMDVEAPRVARACQPGEFVIVKMDEVGERIPLTICDFDREKGLVTIVFQIVGASTMRMAELKAGDYFQDFVGPLGQPSEFVKEDLEEVKKRKYLFVAGGVGSAPVYPQVKWMREHGIDVDVIEGSKTKSLLILEDKLRAAAGNLYVTTDDGSYERKGMVTEVIKDLVENQGKKYDVCVAIGPMIMMKFVCKLTKELGIPTIVSLNPIMVDGTVNSHSAWEIAKTIQPQFKDTPVEKIATIVDRYKSQDTWKENTVFEKDSFELLENILEESGELKKRVPYEKLVRTDFSINAVNAVQK